MKSYLFILILIILSISVYAEGPVHECRMYGAVNATPSTMYRHLVTDTYSLRGLSSVASGNVDGWATVYYNNSDYRAFRSQYRAEADSTYNKTISYVTNSTYIMQAHVRHATSGCTAHEAYQVPNPHPFVKTADSGTKYVFEHNGGLTVATLRTLINTNYQKRHPLNASNVANCSQMNTANNIDSELYFTLILQEIDGYQDNIIGMKSAVSKVRLSGLTGTANFLLNNGTHLFGYRKGETLWFYYNSTTKSFFIASQEPMTAYPWIQMNNSDFVYGSAAGYTYLRNFSSNFNTTLFYNGNYSYCKDIKLKNYQGTTKNNFPVYLNLTREANMTSTAVDLAFKNAPCTKSGVQLFHEVPYNDTIAAITHVRTNLSGITKNISVYYGTPYKTYNKTNAQQVFKAYSAVWHLNSLNVTDSNPNVNTTPRLAGNWSAIGPGQVFNLITGGMYGRVPSWNYSFVGAGDFYKQIFSYDFCARYSRCSPNITIQNKPNLTVEVWATQRKGNISCNAQELFSMSSAAYSYEAAVQNTIGSVGTTAIMKIVSRDKTSALKRGARVLDTSNNWCLVFAPKLHHYMFRYVNNTFWQIIIDGQINVTNSTSPKSDFRNNIMKNLSIMTGGNEGSNSAAQSGEMYEFRWDLKADKAQDWANQSYRNIAYYSDMVTVSSASLINPNEPFVSTTNTLPTTTIVTTTQASGGGGGGTGETQHSELFNNNITTHTTTSISGTTTTTLSLDKRLTSQIKIPGNGICDDGENFLLDADCKLDMNTLFNQMWFMRLVALATIIAFIAGKDYAILILMFGLSLFMFNSNSVAASTATTTTTSVVVSTTINSCDIYNAGACVLPSNPMFGWVIVIAIFIYLLKKILDMVT